MRPFFKHCYKLTTKFESQLVVVCWFIQSRISYGKIHTILNNILFPTRKPRPLCYGLMTSTVLQLLLRYWNAHAGDSLDQYCCMTIVKHIAFFLPRKSYKVYISSLEKNTKETRNFCKEDVISIFRYQNNAVFC